jgi:hypothetical protein
MFFTQEKKLWYTVAKKEFISIHSRIKKTKCMLVSFPWSPSRDVYCNVNTELVLMSVNQLPLSIIDYYKSVQRYAEVEVKRKKQGRSKSQVNPSPKTAQSPIVQQNESFKEKYSKRKIYTCYVGMDISILCPAVCLRIHTNDSKNTSSSASQTHFHFIYFEREDVSESKADLQLEHTYHLFFHSLPPQQERRTFRFDMDWYYCLTNSLLEKLHHILESYNLSKQDTRIIIENYAFDVQDTSSLTKLSEFTALIKLNLRNAGYKYTLLSNSTVKKWFGGHGRAFKEHMWLALQESYSIIAKAFQKRFNWNYSEKKQSKMERLQKALLPKPVIIIKDKEWEWLNYESDVDTRTNREKHRKKQKIDSFETEAQKKYRASKKESLEIPHPIQDLIDALGLIETFILNDSHKSTR